MHTRRAQDEAHPVVGDPDVGAIDEQRCAVRAVYRTATEEPCCLSADRGMSAHPVMVFVLGGMPTSCGNAAAEGLGCTARDPRAGQVWIRTPGAGPRRRGAATALHAAREVEAGCSVSRRYPNGVTSNDDPADGHARFRQLSAAVRESGPGDDSALLAALLTEPDRLMAESVLMSLVDTRAEGLSSAASFAAWAEPVVDAVGADGFIARRVQEWALFKALQSGEPVDREALAAASNWLQRKLVEEADSAAVLAVLGEAGRTKRVRNLAKTRAGRLRSAGR
ncbi:hypothetical protein [Dactylosporangium salmoneum]